MTNFLCRCYVFLCSIAVSLATWGQDVDDIDLNELPNRSGKGDDAIDMEDMLDYSPMHISFSDIITVVGLLVLCYVFGKIWKGCSYLIIILAIVFYLMTH